MARLTKISFLPSIFTLSSLFLGYLAIMQIVNGHFTTAVYLITGSVILDGFDGTVARLTKTESNFGVQLDSLVDAVAFGVVTSVMIFRWGFIGIEPAGIYPQVGKIIGFAFLSAGIIRLARFNVLKEAEAYVSNVFVGLPIPLGALSVASYILVFPGPLKDKMDIFAFSAFVLLVAFLMISNVKYRTMKRIRSKNNLLILFFMTILIGLSIVFFSITIPSITAIYLISPLFFFFIDKTKKNRDEEEDDVPVENNATQPPKNSIARDDEKPDES
ncbi:MAG: CDP-diacylglycerol--serine O-phosphatidyltransferase [bacterium]|nr:CDP-diacylglycerol--serine O-phosphatidyltransferase [bacterium]